MEEETKVQQIRSKAVEFLLIEDWNESIKAYSQFIPLCQQQICKTLQESDLLELRKSLCLALSN